MSANSKPQKHKQPFAMQWTIPEQNLRQKRNSNGKCSTTLSTSGYEFEALFYPNGDEEGCRGETWIFFYIGLNGVEVELNVTIESANVVEPFDHVCNKKVSHGFRLCSTEELFNEQNGYIVDGEMNIEIEGVFITEKFYRIPSWKLGGDSLCLDLWNQENKDFSIIVDGKEIKAHKCVLAARSPVFEAMFQPQTKESQEGKFEIPDFSFEIVEMAIKLCYSQCDVEDVSPDDIALILQFFDKYNLQSLKADLNALIIKSRSYYNSIATVLKNELCVNLWDQKTKDFTFVVGKKRIQAHKCILALRSPVFEAMLKPHTQEAQENQVTIPDFKFKIVEMAIKLFYHHSLVEVPSLAGQMLLFQFFDKYDAQPLTNDLVEYMISKIDENNVCRLINFSLSLNVTKLLKKCTKFLRNCLYDVEDEGPKAISDIDTLDKDFAFNFFKKAFYKIV